jgi:hypothetical protein
MRETRQSGSEGGARNIPLSLPLSLLDPTPDEVSPFLNPMKGSVL